MNKVSESVEFYSPLSHRCLAGECGGDIQGSYHTLTMEPGNNFLQISVYVDAPEREKSKVTFCIGSVQEAFTEIISCQFDEFDCKVKVAA